MSLILVITAVRHETRAVLAALPSGVRRRGGTSRQWESAAGSGCAVRVVEAGVGPTAARRAAEACGADCALWLSAGFAGGLVAELRVGDLMAPARIVWEEGATTRTYAVPVAIHRTLFGALSRMGVTAGTLYSSPVVVASSTAKLEHGRRLGARAVEMEAGAVAAVAQARGTPLAALRVILDPAELSLEMLPKNIAISWAARAKVMATPRVWPLLAALKRHAEIASAALTVAMRAALAALGPDVRR